MLDFFYTNWSFRLAGPALAAATVLTASVLANIDYFACAMKIFADITALFSNDVFIDSATKEQLVLRRVAVATFQEGLLLEHGSGHFGSDGLPLQ